MFCFLDWWLEAFIGKESSPLSIWLAHPTWILHYYVMWLCPAQLWNLLWDVLSILLNRCWYFWSTSKVRHLLDLQFNPLWQLHLKTTLNTVPTGHRGFTISCKTPYQKFQNSALTTHLQIISHSMFTNKRLQHKAFLKTYFIVSRSFYLVYIQYFKGD